MNRMKKLLLSIIFVTLGVLLCMSTKAFAFDTSGLGIGSTASISLKTMDDSKNLYCVAYGKAMSDNASTFRVNRIITIEGKKVTEKQSDGTTRVVTENSYESSVLAAILGGAVTPGYGTTANPNPAQCALWGYWNTWCDRIGTQLGFQKNTKNDDYANNENINTAKKAAIIKDYKVTIYLLSNGNENWQELIAVDVGEPPHRPEPETNPTTVTGYVNISGYVWEDIANSKSNTINSKMEDEDIRVEGIKVHWKATDGTEIASTTTGKDGSYKLSTTLDLYNHPYAIKDKAKYDKINNSYIEFEYNGLKYTTVAYDGNLAGSDTSKGKENEGKRTEVDNKFDKVENRAVYDGNNAIISNLPNTQITDANYTSEFAVSASTQNIVRLLLKETESNGWTEKKTFCNDHCQVGEGPHLAHTYTKNGATFKIYCNGEAESSDLTQFTIEEVTQYSKELMGNQYNQANGGLHYYSADEIDGPTHRDCRSSIEGTYVWNINNMNLGLVRREQPDGAIVSDIEKVRVIMKNQEYTYIYGNRGISNTDALIDYKIKWQNKYNAQVYTRPINPSDIAYVNYNNTDDLKVYVTYDIILKNQSETLPMTINKFVNYYDSNYTIYTGPGTATSSGWEDTGETNNGYKVAYNTTSIKLQPKTKSEVIRIEFEVNQDRIKGLLNEDTTLNNVSEIISYTTYYGENTICAERETAATKGKTGQQYAGLDPNSTPGNVIPGNLDTYNEDDTDKAPSFLLVKDPNYKTMTGIVYEDTQTAESKNINERLGNGQKEENEKGVENVRVELLNPDTGAIADLYYKDTSTESGANKKPAVTYTDANGNYSFGDAETCGVVVDKYIVKYTYGNADKDGNAETEEQTKINGNVINARNYKSTIIVEPNVKSVMQGNESNKWHLNMNEGVDTSIAIDDIQERLSQPTLKYETYNDAVNMSAYSKPFDVQIEYTPNQQSQVNENGEKDGNFQRNWAVFDFGIIERPRENVIINKTISKIKLTLANGQVLLEGDPRKDNMNYVKAMGFEERAEAEFDAMDANKALSIEMDQELIQGSTLEMWYLITLTNNSEKDYEYETNQDYYYYGTNKTDVLALADLVVDYMSSKVSCNVGDDFTMANADGINNKDWFRYDNGVPTDAEYLKNNGYISYKLEGETEDKTYETIKNSSIQSIATNTFDGVLPGETKKSVIYASKELGNQEENHLYDNHVEIVALNSKTARTIDSVDDTTRAQNDKKYQPGNYIPSLSNEVHQQDDDRVKVTITPPTGIENYITIYIISAVVGLIVIVGGIVLIKKKIMNK